MNTTENKNLEVPVSQARPSLPPLIKQSTTYKLLVPRKVEEKIRYLIRKYPSTEWSGVLFYTHTGSFERGDLEIKCEDIFPMDLGTGTFTDFKMDESVVGYIAENIDLFGCDTGLVHSHHKLGAFLSGTDTETVRAEGNDTNCFVSLVVDTKGTYVAAVTRKVQTKKEITTKYLGTSYQFFGDGEIQLEGGREPAQRMVEDTAIEYYMLDVEIEHVDNPLEYLDYRFDEIEQKKQSRNAGIIIPSGTTSLAWPPKKQGISHMIPEVPDYDFTQWREVQDALNIPDAKEGITVQEQNLFSDEEMREMEDVSGWNPDPTIIHDLTCKMVTCSLIISSERLDLKQWIVRHMEKKYREIFGSSQEDTLQFQEWKEFIVEFLINQYDNPQVPAPVYDDWDTYQGKIANAIHNELYQYPSNIYIEEYQEVLTRYMYE